MAIPPSSVSFRRTKEMAKKQNSFIQKVTGLGQKTYETGNFPPIPIQKFTLREIRRKTISVLDASVFSKHQ